MIQLSAQATPEVESSIYYYIMFMPHKFLYLHLKLYNLPNLPMLNSPLTTWFHKMFQRKKELILQFYMSFSKGEVEKACRYSVLGKQWVDRKHITNMFNMC